MTEIYPKQWIQGFGSCLLELIIKNNYLNNYSEKVFVKHINFEKRKTLKKELNEELMPAA